VNPSPNCPQCASSDVFFSKKHSYYICEDCRHTFTEEKPRLLRRIFLSYGHDEHATLAQRLKEDLEARGHEVWFDLERLSPGGDWERYIEEGLEWVAEDLARGCVVLLMTPHSVRRPGGYCHNEVARAISRSLTVVPVMVVRCEPPLSICRIQWLDMMDCVPVQERDERYEVKLERLAEALERGRLDFEGIQARLLARLKPLPFDADIAQHLERFTGREWVFERIDAWLREPEASRVFWITGAPGVGKTAIASWLCHHREVVAFHLCQHGHVQKSDPRRAVLSIAYQLATQLPDFEERLAALDLERLVPESNARTLFDCLVVQPLSGGFPDPGRTLIVLIDALDEATREGGNELASFGATEFLKTPPWLRLIITSRPDPEVTHPLQGLTPYELDTTIPENEADIRAYLERELRPYTREREVPRAAIDTIVARSEGIFLYAEWVRQELAQNRLSLERIEEFPKGLGGVYAEFFRRRFPDTGDYKKRIRPLLEVILAAHEPLGVDYVATIFRWSEYDRVNLLESLGSLFPVREGRIQAFHRAVGEWLTDQRKAGKNYFVSLWEGSKRLADQGWIEYERAASSMSGYALAHLPTHLAGIGRGEDLVTLLTDFGFLEAKIAGLGPQSLVEDYEMALGSDNLSAEEAQTLSLIQGAVQLSAHVLMEDAEQLAGHLVGRLMSHESAATRDFLKRVRRSPQKPWLKPLTPSLAQAGGALLRTLEGHTDDVRAVAVTPEGRRAVSGSGDKTLKVWDLESGALLRTLNGHASPVNAVAVTSDGQRAVSGAGSLSESKDNTLRLWNLETGAVLRTFEGHTDRVSAVAVTPDGRQVVSASKDETLRIWDMEKGILLRTLAGHTHWVEAVAVTPDGHRAVSGSLDGTLKVWNLDTGALLHTLEGHSWGIQAVAVTPDGHRAVSGSSDCTVRVWDLEAGVLLRTLEGHSRNVRAIAVTPDGSWAVSGSLGRTLKVWDLETGTLLRTLEGHSSWVEAIAVTPDGRHAVSGLGDATIKIWGLDAGAPLCSPQGHADGIGAIALTPDGGRAISGSFDKTLKVWDMETGAHLRTLAGHPGQWTIPSRYGTWKPAPA